MKKGIFIAMLLMVAGCASTDKPSYNDLRNLYGGGTVLCYTVIASIGGEDTGLACSDALLFLNR